MQSLTSLCYYHNITTVCIYRHYEFLTSAVSMRLSQLENNSFEWLRGSWKKTSSVSTCLKKIISDALHKCFVAKTNKWLKPPLFSQIYWGITLTKSLEANHIVFSFICTPLNCEQWKKNSKQNQKHFQKSQSKMSLCVYLGDDRTWSWFGRPFKDPCQSSSFLLKYIFIVTY